MDDKHEPKRSASEIALTELHAGGKFNQTSDAGQPLAVGQLGHVRARVLDGLCGYVGDKATSQRFFREGWFYSGDLGTFRADGRLALGGRVTDVVNIMGNKLATGPLERSLQDQLGAEAVCMLSLPDRDGDEVVHVVIGRRRKLTRPELEALSKGPLRAIPKLQFVVLPSLPRNAMGKVLRVKVRQLLEPGQGRR
jgi:acyl-coenzyme A synthetase/AMP-(fatty) acid ligase